MDIVEGGQFAGDILVISSAIVSNEANTGLSQGFDDLPFYPTGD